MITEQERKRLWEWCGFSLKLQEDPYMGDPPYYFWVNPHGLDGYGTEKQPRLPIPTLDSLFKWAVPKLGLCDMWFFGLNSPISKVSKINRCDILVDSPDPYHFEAEGEGPAEALARAILKVIDVGQPQQKGEGDATTTYNGG